MPAGWNKGLSKLTDERVRKNATAQSLKMKAEAAAMTPDERKQRWGKGHRVGGIRKGAGRGKKGWYKGYWCDSSWELAWVIYQLDHGEIFVRNTEGFEYTYKGIRRKFYPDFIIRGTYIEIKGWLDAINKEKIHQFVKTLVVLGKNEMKPYLQYVEKAYGKDFIRLMGITPPEYRCMGCGTLVSRRSKQCASCAAKLQPTKIDWPDTKTLRELVNSTSYADVGRRLGVSDNAVRGRIKRHGGEYGYRAVSSELQSDALTKLC